MYPKQKYYLLLGGQSEIYAEVNSTYEVFQNISFMLTYDN